ncbi:MAG: tRNA (adenosine(37)-N6)-dimethylallyltransferase MiaA [Rikenellaceae bacterium]
MTKTKKYVIVLLGPTGVGKTDLSIGVAKHFNACIVSSDSRQLYKEMRIGTAVPTNDQLSAVKHYLIQTESISTHYTAGKYEKDALRVISELHEESNCVVVSGGSGLYIDALCNGIDEIAPSDENLRKQLSERLENEGIESLVEELKELDAEYVASLDVYNKSRVIRALEVCISTGKKYSDLRTGLKKKRDFEIIKIGLTLPRAELYERINLRVDLMLEEGLEQEVKALYPMRKLNALQTVGYREFFDCYDGNVDFETAVELVKRNSRRYAKRQMTWFNRDKDTKWFSPKDETEIIEYIEEKIHKD